MDTRIPDTPTGAAPLSEAALCAWLGAAAPGERLAYHRGFLARDLSPLTQLLPDAERLALLRLANRAWALAEAGLAHLLQRRHGYEDYEYLLVARPRPRRVAPSILPAILAEAA
ncbi:hypothetical protein [Crenalkalicoccus roseus]|uniref:hypothetical protein n=1 Tax=Crenalkalicoccus roseus TaxID=1485588 RepID=UPI001080F552|nr:hypothetical protein [Crenalkalicoccus roseus]